MAAHDRYEPLNSIDESSFEAFYRIYLASMPARERKSKAFLAAMAARADYRMLLIKRKGEVIGFSVMFAPPEESFCLLEYMAVDVDYRGGGVGGRLFLRSVQDAAGGRDDLAVLLEVDSEREPSADHAIRQRRQQFYRRLGCHRIDGLDYILPLPGAGAPPRMDIMIYFPGTKSTVGKARLERWLRVIYHGVYGCSSNDPRVTQMMSTVADPVIFV